MATYDASVDLPSTSEAPRAARRLLHETLTVWQWADDERRAAAALLASELVTNAVEHVGNQAGFRFEVSRIDDQLQVCVVDNSAARPVLRQLSYTTPRGRGIRLVAAIAQRWGCEDHPRGKRVWFELDGAT